MFELITTSGLTDSAKADLAAFQAELAESETLSANLVLVDNETLQARYDEALNRNRPYINYEFSIEQGKYMEMQIGATRAVIAAIPLKECIKIPGIRTGRFSEKMYASLSVPGIRLIKELLAHCGIIRRSSSSFTME